MALRIWFGSGNRIYRCIRAKETTLSFSMDLHGSYSNVFINTGSALANQLLRQLGFVGNLYDSRIHTIIRNVRETKRFISLVKAFITMRGALSVNT